MFRAPSETFSDAYDVNAAVTVSINNLPSLSNSLQDLTDYKLRITISGFDQTMIESKNTTLANRPAHMTVKEQESSIIDIGMGSEQKIMEVWTIYDDKWYNIMFVAPADRYETYFPVVHSMIDSFHIIS
jgi:hypothetical protein